MFTLDAMQQLLGPLFPGSMGVRLTELGARQKRTLAGASVVMATDTPFVFDPKIKRIDGYAWKSPFYVALGADTFMHEGQKQREMGELVPDFDAHRRAAGFKRAAVPTGGGETFELRLAYAGGPSSAAEISRLLAQHEEITAPARVATNVERIQDRFGPRNQAAPA